MNLFFDSSALVKLFHREIGTERLQQLLLDAGTSPHVSELARLEFYTTLYRRRREKSIGHRGLVAILEEFEAEWASYSVEPLGTLVTQEAVGLLKEFGEEHGLRTLDALHLATFVLLAEDDWVFVVADSRLAEIARKRGFQVFNPLES
ncbi:MAG: type II toxin-antitoxin system VapC family toxin [Chloroflexi bacterium]|nr:type II toxin-antitoxin system VapC family toxin [Chloroflexota bacterium]